MTELHYIKLEQHEGRYTIYVNGHRYRWWHRLLRRLPGGATWPQGQSINADTFTTKDTTRADPPNGGAWLRP